MEGRNLFVEFRTIILRSSPHKPRS
jgi:hypothetical protein